MIKDKPVHFPKEKQKRLQKRRKSQSWVLDGKYLMLLRFLVWWLENIPQMVVGFFMVIFIPWDRIRNKTTLNKQKLAASQPSGQISIISEPE